MNLHCYTRNASLGGLLNPTHSKSSEQITSIILQAMSDKLSGLLKSAVAGAKGSAKALEVASQSQSSQSQDPLSVSEPVTPASTTSASSGDTDVAMGNTNGTGAGPSGSAPAATAAAHPKVAGKVPRKGLLEKAKAAEKAEAAAKQQKAEDTEDEMEDTTQPGDDEGENKEEEVEIGAGDGDADDADVKAAAADADGGDGDESASAPARSSERVKHVQKERESVAKQRRRQLATSAARKAARKAEVADGVAKKPHRFRPGTSALRAIRKEQKTSWEPKTEREKKIGVRLPFKHAPFTRLVREIAEEMKNDLRFQERALYVLNVASGKYLEEVFHKSNTAAVLNCRKGLDKNNFLNTAYNDPLYQRATGVDPLRLNVAPAEPPKGAKTTKKVILNLAPPVPEPRPVPMEIAAAKEDAELEAEDEAEEAEVAAAPAKAPAVKATSKGAAKRKAAPPVKKLAAATKAPAGKK
jgi:histone H3